MTKMCIESGNKMTRFITKSIDDLVNYLKFLGVESCNEYGEIMKNISEFMFNRDSLSASLPIEINKVYYRLLLARNDQEFPNF
ncbi:MAG: hypothetical protein SFH39_00125 [Candidatus Magnetobacterium sp. LHC-1]